MGHVPDVQGRGRAHLPPRLFKLARTFRPCDRLCGTFRIIPEIAAGRLTALAALALSTSLAPAVFTVVCSPFVLFSVSHLPLLTPDGMIPVPQQRAVAQRVPGWMLNEPASLASVRKRTKSVRNQGARYSFELNSEPLFAGGIRSFPRLSEPRVRLLSRGCRDGQRAWGRPSVLVGRAASFTALSRLDRGGHISLNPLAELLTGSPLGRREGPFDELRLVGVEAGACQLLDARRRF